MTDDRRPEYLARLIRNGYIEGQVRGLREQGHTFKKIAAMLNLSLDHVKQFNAEDTGRQISRRRSRTEQLEAENAALQAEVERLRERLHDAIESREGFIRHATLAAKERYEAAEKENAALREIAQEVADHPGVVKYADIATWCAFCQSPRTQGRYQDIVHDEDCPVVKARALLASES